MTQQASRSAAATGQAVSCKRSRLLHSCSALAAVIVLSGSWGTAAQAQMVTPTAASRPTPDSQAMLQQRAMPEIHSIADANRITDSRITLQTPSLPQPPPMRPQAPVNAQVNRLPTVNGSTGTVVIPGGQPPVVATRMDGTTSAQGSFAVSSGAATINRDALKDQVQVTTPQAIINWTTFDTATLATTDSYINFLPAGTELEFIGTGANYTVLNRVFGTPDAGGEYRGIAFNGTVTSRLSDAGPIGGNVWFYSPGGILVNNGATFNVGSLVLSASAINAITGGGTTIDFTGVTQADSAILIANGASINALNQGSYVAMVAPRIEQAGTVTVNGSVAYVGAEEAQLRIDNGLFDIAIGLGTEDANGVVHTGTTTGPARQVTQGMNNILTDPDGQGIYMVAVPKNTALTMLVGGTVGYQPASNASMTPNGVLVLGSGTDIESDVDILSGTQTIEYDGRDAVDGGGIRIAGANFTSDVTSFASGQFALQVGNNQAFAMGGDGRGGYSLDATGGTGIIVSATGNGTIDILGDLNLDSGQDQAIGAPISISVGVDPSSPTGPAGTINIGGNLVADSSGVGRDDFFTIRQNGNTGIGEDATGGDISLTVSGGGSISVGGDTSLDASAQGGKGEFRSGSSTGGDVTIAVTGATSSLNLPNFVQVFTTGIDADAGKIGGGGAADLGADSIAGDFSLIVDGGNLDLGFAQIETSANATSGSDDTQAQENTARAGDVTFRFTGGSQDIGNIQLFGNAIGGTSFDANGVPFEPAVTLGELTFVMDGSQTTFGRDFSVFAGSGFSDPANPNTTTFTITNGANVSLCGDFNYDTNNLNDSVVLTVDQGSTLDIGGSLSFSFFGRTTDIASDSGVDITINVDNATLTTGFLQLDSSIENDSFENLAITGGNIAINLTNGALLDAGFTSISANARGRALGSSATGGNVAIIVDSSTFRSTGGVDISANGVAARSNIDPTSGASSGRGGNVRFVATGTNPLVDIGDLFISADGRFDFGFEESSFLAPIGGPGGPVTMAAGPMAAPQAAGGLGEGGDASGGTVEMTIDSGTVNALSVSVSSSGYGENGSSGIIDDGINPPVGFAGTGGSGTGGTVTFNMDGGTANFDSLTVSANGLGGNGAFSDESYGVQAGDGGTGTGGSTTLNARGGTLNVTNGIALQALGNAEIFDFGFPFVSIQGSGGTGFGVEAGNGGGGIGGSATLNLIGAAASVNAGSIEISAESYGGDGGNSFDTFSAGGPIPGQNAGTGGNASGGTATLNHTAGSIDSGTLTVTTGATGGFGGSSFGLSTGQAVNSGGRGGDATGGTATINLNQDDASNPTYFARSVATGGQGGAGFTGGTGGDGTGGTAQILVNNVDVSLTTAAIDTSGTGGSGGFSDGEAGTGGSGGSGTGGTTRLVVDGPNGVLTADSPISIAASGTGGAGTAGGDSFNDTDPGGLGGDGGLGTGGRVEILATNGAVLDFTANRGIVDAAGIGGTGGAGGNGLIFQGGNGGRGGNAVGGSIAVSSTGGSDLTIAGASTTVTLQAGATGGAGGDGGLGAGSTTGLVGVNGASTGGTIVATAGGGRLTFAGQLSAIASAIGFADTRPGSAGGDATGGDITIETLGAGSELIVTGGIAADASAAAALGVSGNGAGVGGSATGGSINIVLAEGSTVDIATIDTIASGTGADGIGGGSGTGGDVRIAIATDAASLTSISADVRARGGNSGSVTGSGPGQNGSLGGNAQGGTAEVLVVGTGPLLDSLTGLSLNASATAGNGGRGSASNGLTDGYLGGNGGNATGGTASLSIAGDGASLTVDALAVSLRADATGGAGGAGGDNLTGGSIGAGGVVINNRAGNGGIGGSGTGGTVLLEAGSGSTMTLQQSSGPFELAASGFGGRGGSGGNLDLVNGGIQGTGGDGGTGTGGSPTLLATGGTIQGDDVSLFAQGVGGDGGQGGDDGNATFGPSGNGGDAFGGTPTVETQDGSPGIITLGNLLIDATSLAGGGTFQGIALGGQVTITDGSVDPAGLISMSSLTVLASGNATTSGYPSLTISSGSGPITVSGNMSANVSGDILLNFDDDGQLLVGGGVDLFAGGDFRITHTNTALNTISLDVGGNILAQIFGEINAQAGTAISGNEVFLLAGQSAVINDVRGVPNVQIIAGGNVLLNDAVATGPQGVSNVGGIRIEAGRNPFAFPPVYNPTVTALIVGTVDSYSDISVISGGSARFLAGSTTIAGDGISVTTGDDIIVEAGASLTSARSPSNPPDPADPFNGAASIDLFAGGITNFLSTPLTPLASIVVDGSIDAGPGAIIARGNAIDGLDGSFSASSISLDINDAPGDGVPQSDDAGLLSANCLQGNICLGSIFADNVIEIGQASNNDVIQLIVQQGTVNANEIRITTRNDIVMGTDGIATTLNASNLFSVESIQGDVDLREAAISSGQILIAAGGSLIGSAALSSTDDIGITVGSSLSAASIDTGGELTTVADVGGALEGFYSVAGDISIGSLTVGAGNVNYDAGGNIDIGAIDVPGTDIILAAPGLVQLGFTGSANNIDLNGGFVSVGDISASGQIGLVSASDVQIGSATAGDTLTVDSQGNVSFSGLQAGSDLVVTAPGSISGGDLFAGSLRLDGGFIAIGTANAATIDFVSATDILFDLLQSSSPIVLTAANGRIAAHTAAGDIESDSDVTLDAQEIAVGNITSGGSVVANATLGDASFGTIDAIADITVEAVGSPILANAISGGNTSITGASVTFNNGTIGGDLALTATAGDIDGNGAVTVGGGIALDAAGNVGFGSLAAEGGDFTITAGGDILADHAEASGNFTATAGGGFTTGLNSIITGGDIVIAAGGIADLGNSSAGGLVAVSAQQIDFVSVAAGQTVTLVTGQGTLSPPVGNGNITGQTVTAGFGDSLIRASDGGDIAISGIITADGVQVVADAGSITSGGLNTRLFAVLNAAGAITLTGNSVGTNTFFAEGASIELGNSAITNGNVSLVARSGGVTGTGQIDANGELVVSAAQSVSLTGDLIAASGIRINATGIALGNATSDGQISLAATSGGVTSPGRIEAGTDLFVQTSGGADLNEIVAGDDIEFTGSGDISIARMEATGENPQTEEIGSNGTFTITGNVFVDHAEVADNLVATVTGGFATGLNSILTGGDIVIDAGGPVALGNSSAGGLVNVSGSQIGFVTLAAGQTVALLTEPSPQTGFGNGNITGTDLTAGAGASSVNSTFGSVSIGGQTTVAGSLTVAANQAITLGTVAVQGGNLAATAGGSIALASASASGNAGLTAGGPITATGNITAGGTLTLLAQTGAIAARDLIANGLNATAAGDIGLRDVILSGGGASLVSGGAVALRDVTGAGASGVSITADGNLGFDDIASVGGVSLLASNGGIDGVSITSGGAVSVDGQTVGLGSVAATGDVFGTAESGALVAGSISSSAGEVFLQGATAVDVGTLAAATDSTVQGGQVAIGSAGAGGNLSLTSGAASGIATGALTAGGAIAASSGTGGFAGTTLDAGGDVAVASGAGIAFDTITAGGAATLAFSGAGDIVGTGIAAGTSITATTGGSFTADTVSAGGAVDLSAVTGISLSTLVGSTARLAAAGGEVRVSVEIDVPGLVDASGLSVFLRSTRNLAVSATATAGYIDILTDRDLDVSGAQATGGNISLTSTSGVATVAGVNAALPATGTATGGNVSIAAGENLNVAGAVTAANNIELRAGERASIDAAVVGREIDLRASDVAISSDGAIGLLDTTRSVTISGGGIARIGGDDGTDQSFVLDNEEFSRIQASGQIAISASTAIILDQLDIQVANATSATGNVGGEGRVSFSAGEGIDVIGEVVMTGATADNAIALSTGGDVFLDASTGLVEINNGSGTYLGAIEVEASNFLAMTEQARTDVAAATSIEAIDDRLAQNDGIDNPDGLIRTGTLDITTTTSNVFIQNTAPGTRFAERRGFTVDELLISDPAGTNQPIVINGIIGGATGVDAIPLAQISSTFDPGSTINGCLIANPAGCSEIPDNLGAGSFPIQDLIDDQLDDEEAGEPGLGSGLLETPLFELKDPLETSEDPLLDDPVTGAGNEDLWVGEQPGK